MRQYCYVLLFTLLLAASSSCSSVRDDNAGAEAMLERIEKAVEAGEYSRALELADSLDSVYKAAVDIRRKAMPLRAKAHEGVALQRIPQVDEAIADAMLVIEQYGPAMVRVGEGADYYMVPADWPGRGNVKATGIEPRIDSNANFRIVLKNSGKPIELNTLRLESAVGGVSTAAVDGSRVARLNDSEMVSLTQEELAPVTDWLQSHTNDSGLKARLAGSGGAVDVQLTPAMAASLVHARDFALAQQQIMRLSAERTKLERQLQIARDQQAHAN